MKKLFFLICVFYLQHLSSQGKFAKEFSFVNDNDLYISTSKDRYYTNGMFFTYRYLAKNNTNKLEKRIFEFQLGHQMYSPFKAVILNKSDHDRPFAGYLYGRFGVNRVFKDQRILKTSVQVGILGPNSFAEELQDAIHNIYGFVEAVGWKYQIQEAIGLQIEGEYIKHIASTSTGFSDISLQTSFRFGSVFTDLTTGFYSRIGFKPLEKLMNTIAFGTSINNDSTSYVREVESFLYVKPFLNYAFYDATLQGSIFNDNNDITKELINFRAGIELGYRFTSGNWNFGYAINYQTSKSKGLRYKNGNTYGVIQVNFLIR